MIVVTVNCEGYPALAERIGVDYYECLMCGATDHPEMED